MEESLRPKYAEAVVPAVVLGLALGVAQTAPLTLPEAQSLAERNNEAKEIAQARLTRAHAEQRRAWSALIPSLTFQTTFTRRVSEVTRQVGDQNVVLQEANGLGGNLSLDWPLFDARAFAGLAAADQGQRATVLEAAELERALAFAVATGFFLVLAEDSLQEAAHQRTLAAESTLAEAKARQAAGLAAKNEVTRAELELATAKLEVSSAMAAALRARLALSELIGAEVEAGRSLVEPPPSTLPALVSEELVKQARAARPDFLALGARAEQADALEDEPLLRLVPTLSLKGLIFASNEPGLSGRTIDANVAVALSWKIFDGGLRYADHAQRLADLEEARLKIRAAERHVAREVRESLVGLTTAQAAAELAEVRYRTARQNAEEVHVLYGNGLASALERVDAAVSEYDAAAGLSRQKVAVRIAELEVLRAVGAWPLERAEETR